VSILRLSESWHRLGLGSERGEPFTELLLHEVTGEGVSPLLHHFAGYEPAVVARRECEQPTFSFCDRSRNVVTGDPRLEYLADRCPVTGDDEAKNVRDVFWFVPLRVARQLFWVETVGNLVDLRADECCVPATQPERASPPGRRDPRSTDPTSAIRQSDGAAAGATTLKSVE